MYDIVSMLVGMVDIDSYTGNEQSFGILQSQHCIALGPTNVWIAISNLFTPTLFIPTLFFTFEQYQLRNYLYIYLTKPAGIVLCIYMSV